MDLWGGGYHIYIYLYIYAHYIPDSCKGDTRSLDYGSCEAGFWSLGLGLRALRLGFRVWGFSTSILMFRALGLGA